jgi:hypothetical protein
LIASPDPMARALQLYLRRRAAGRRAPEFVRARVVVEPKGHEPGLRAWERVDGPGEGVKTLRRPGAWCPWLGRSLLVAENQSLQAVFATWSDDDAPWAELARRARSDAAAIRVARELCTAGERLLKAASRRADALRRGEVPPRSGGPLQGLFVPREGAAKSR